MYAKFSKVIDFSTVGFKNKRGQNRVSAEKEKTQKLLKPYHHVRLDGEFKLDCKVWLQFLMNPELCQIVNRPMIDMDLSSYTDIRFYSDASKAKNLGFGCTFGNNWIFGQWPQLFIEQKDPRIEFLELYALVTGLLTWQDSLVNVRVMVFCDNIAAIHKVNNTTSSCSQCMKLIRILVLNGLKYNRSIRAKFVSTKKNRIADALSRLQIKRFRKLAPDANKLPDEIDNRMWPVTKIW